MKNEIKKLFLIGTMIMGITALAGCSNTQKTVQPETDVKEKVETKAEVDPEAESSKEDKQEVTSEPETDEKAEQEATPEPETEKEDEQEATSEPENTEEANAETTSELGTLIPEVSEYLNSTYGDHLSNGGEEAFFLHGGRYISTCPDLDANVVYMGIWDDETLDYTLEDSSEFLRLEGKAATFFTGEFEELTPDKLISELSKNYAVTYEYMEGAGTAYYITDGDYLHIELSSGSDDPVIILKLACAEGENILPDSFCWVSKQEEC